MPAMNDVLRLFEQRPTLVLAGAPKRNIGGSGVSALLRGLHFVSEDPGAFWVRLRKKVSLRRACFSP